MEIKNNFNYTSVPRELLYCDRHHLDDFGVEKNSSLNYFIEEKLANKYSRFYNYEDFAVEIFNCAYYICTVAYTDSHPERRFGAFILEINQRMHHNHEYEADTFTIVLLQMWARRFDKSHERLMRLYNKIEEELKDKHPNTFENFYILVTQKMLSSGVNRIDSVDEFIPRPINRKVLKDINYWDWSQHFGTDEEKMFDFITAIGKNEEEQKTIVSFLKDETFPPFSNPMEHRYCFESLERRVRRFYHAEEEDAAIDAEIEAQIEQEYQQQFELDFYRDEFPKLKAENESLKAELEKYKNDAVANAPTDEFANVEITRLNEIIEEQNLAIQSFQEQGKGLSAPDAAMFITAICLELNQIPANGRETLSPIIEICWGKSSSTASEALRRKVTEESANKLALKLDELTPKIARLIRQLPHKLEDIKKERLKQINPNS